MNWFRGSLLLCHLIKLAICLKNKKLVELHPQMIDLCVCKDENRHSSATQMYCAQQVLAALWKVQATEAVVETLRGE